MDDPFARLGATIARRRWIVLAVWLVVLGIAGGALAPRAATVLKAGGVVAPGSDSAKATDVLRDEFNASTATSVVIVFHSPTMTADDTVYRDEVVNALGRVAELPQVRSVDSFFTTQNPFLLSNDRKTATAVVSVAGDEAEVENFAGELRPLLDNLTLEHYVTGLPAVNYDIQKTSEHDLQRAELFTVPIVLILLLLVFRTVLAAVIPLVLGAAAVMTALSVLYGIGSATTTSIFALNVASMIGLGLGIDFSLIVVNRFREEIASGRNPTEAVAMTMATAGRSITYSAVTVMAGMLVLSLMLLDLMLVRSISLAVMVVAFTALISGMTLLPALLAVLGPRLEWLPVLPRRRASAQADEGGVWYRLSHAIMRRPWVWLAGSALVLAALASPILRLELIGSTPGVLPAETESVRGVEVLNQGFGANQLTPIQIVVRANERDGAWQPEFLDAVSRLHEAVAADPRTEDSFSLATLPSLAVNTDGLPLGVSLEGLIKVRVDQVPPAPAFVGYAQVTAPPGWSVPSRTYTGTTIVRPESGALSVELGGNASLVRVANATKADLQGPPPPSETPPLNQAFTLNPGDQLVIPPNTPVSARTAGGQPARLLVVSMFVVRGPVEQGTSWTESDQPADLFTGLPRQVLNGSVVLEMPARGAVVAIDRSVFQPGARVPRHTHPGAELLYFETGIFTVFGAPNDEMTPTTAEGVALDHLVPGSPNTMPAGSRVMVQARNIHRAINSGSEPASILSLRVYAADEPPFQVVDPPRNSPPDVMRALPRELFTADEARTAVTARFINVNGNNDTAVLSIISRFDQSEDEHKQFVDDLRETIIPGIPELSPYTVLVGGDAARFIDFRDALYGRFPLLAAAVMGLTFIILMMFFQSVFLPLKAILLNLASILATYGVLVLIFQDGWGHQWFNFEPLGALAVITPVILFVILFGMSTDYEVFMLSRVKEYYHETHDNEEAVARGLQHTAGVITAAGLILVGTFGSFASADVVIVKEIGLGLAIGVLIDSTIIRVIMVPATMRLAGKANWWMPAWLKKIVPELKEGPVGGLAPVPVMAGAGTPDGVARDQRGSRMAMETNGPAQVNMRSVGRLRPIGGSVGADEIVLPRTRPFRIGRDEENELQLYDVRVSKEHARIDFDQGAFFVTDLDSTNGVYINDERITRPTVLRHGDILEIANTGMFTFAFDLAAEPSTPAAGGRA